MNLDSCVKPGTCVINRSFKYLVPGLALYGKELWTKIASLSTHAVGIEDTTHNKENNLYLLVNIKGKIKYDGYIDAAKGKFHFLGVLSWLKEQHYYVDDYPYNSGRNKDFHMIVLKFPVTLGIELFKKGMYSKIYTPEQVSAIFTDEKIKNCLLKTPEGASIFAAFLNDYFKLTGKHALADKDVLHFEEFDIPPELNLETFRWQQ